jgi:hypothetical protein
MLAIIEWMGTKFPMQQNGQFCCKLNALKSVAWITQEIAYFIWPCRDRPVGWQSDC